MKKDLNANTLAQMAVDQIEENDVVNILASLYDEMESETPENQQFDRLFAANRLSKANKVLLDKFKAQVYQLMRSPKDDEARTITIGTRMFKLYYTPSYHFERVHLPELTDEQLQRMSYEQIKAEGEKRDMLDAHHDLFQEIEELEKKLNPKKLQLKGLNEALAAMMPDSKAIKRSPVLQVL